MYIEVRFHAERDIPSLGVRTGGWVEVDVSAELSSIVVAVVALGVGGGGSLLLSLWLSLWLSQWLSRQCNYTHFKSP